MKDDRDIEWCHFDGEAIAQCDGIHLRISNMGKRYKESWWAWVDGKPLLTAGGRARHWQWRSGAQRAAESVFRTMHPPKCFVCGLRGRHKLICSVGCGIV